MQNKPREEEPTIGEAVFGTESFRHRTNPKHLADYGCRTEYKCYEPQQGKNSMTPLDSVMKEKGWRNCNTVNHRIFLL